MIFWIEKGFLFLFCKFMAKWKQKLVKLGDGKSKDYWRELILEVISLESGYFPQNYCTILRLVTSLNGKEFHRGFGNKIWNQIPCTPEACHEDIIHK